MQLIHFEIERSDNGSRFFGAELNSWKQNHLQLSDYTGISGSEYAWYRLKVYGKNGSIHYTNILRFKADDNAQSSAISLYPNPTAEQATITLNLQQAQPFTVQLFDARVNYIGAKAIWAIRAPMLSPSTNYRSIRRELMFYK